MGGIERLPRLPDTILDLMVNRSHRSFFQRFHHDRADEAYASSPSYLISSGGHYDHVRLHGRSACGKHDDIGLALPTDVHADRAVQDAGRPYPIRRRLGRCANARTWASRRTSHAG